MKNQIVIDRIVLRAFLVVASWGWVSCLTLLAQEVRGTPLQTISLDEIASLETVFLSSSEISVAIDSRQKGMLKIDFYNAENLLSSQSWEVEYGINVQTIDLKTILGDAFQYDKKFKITYQCGSRQNAKALFILVKTPPIMPNPVIQLNMDELEVNCENPVLGTTIACMATVDGGTAPYQLTWLVSSSAEVETLLANPVNTQLRNSDEVSRLTIDESPDYYITIRVKDTCGNENQQVVQVQCIENEEEHMLYFQNINIKEEATF